MLAAQIWHWWIGIILIGLALTLRAAEQIVVHDDLDAHLDLLIEAIGGSNPEEDTCLLAVGVSESLLRFGTSLVCEERGGSFFYRKAP